MGGNDEYDMDSLESIPDDPCTGGCCGGCGCNCDKCFCRIDHNVDNNANREHYTGEGGQQHEAVATLPVTITIDRFQAMRMVEDSFNENIIDPNQAPELPGGSLTQANVICHTRSYAEAGSYQEEWLRQERMRVDDDPFAAFLSPAVETEVFDFEQDGVFAPMDLDGSMHVEKESLAGDSRSVASRSTCPRSRSSRSTSQVIAGVEPTPGFVWRPLPLLPDIHLPGVAEVACPNCGGEHEFNGT